METLFVLPWNRRSLCCGIRVRFAVEFAFVLPWNIRTYAAKYPKAVEKITKDSNADYDSMIVDAFVKAFGQKAQAAGQ